MQYALFGWDDTYSKENFKEGIQPANDGAYIVLNSYGDSWGENGYYYISYDDYFIENGMFGIQSISDVDYDNIYQYDKLGKNYAIISSENTIYGANVFTREDNDIEKLTEIGIYIYENNTDVTVYVNNSSDTLDISKLNSVASANDLTVGYHVLKIDDLILVGDTFSIIVKYTNDDMAYLPLEANYVSLGYSSNALSKYNLATSNVGESFISPDGINWDDLYGFTISNERVIKDTNICIKAFTVDLANDASSTEYILNENWKIKEGTNVTMLTGIDENTNISEIVSSNNYIDNYTAKAYKNGVQVTTGKVTTGTVIKIFNGSNEVKQYTIVLYGDTTGDGNIQSLDALAIIKNYLETSIFTNEVYLEAGRVTISKRNDSNSVPSAVDALAVIKHKLGTNTIQQ